ncbi:MAG TPA: rhodanese-like domain-containing protein [Holophagaceae bacterium]
MSFFLDRDEARNLLDRGGLVVDVRSDLEYRMGHADGSLHLPLHLIPVLAAERLPRDRPLLFCCESGARSSQAVQFLRHQGYDAHNLGPWTFHPDLS